MRLPGTFFWLWGTAKFPRHCAPQPGAGGSPHKPHNASPALQHPHNTPHARNTRCQHASHAAVWQNGAVLLHAEAPSHRICSVITTVPPLCTTQPPTMPQMYPHAKGSQALLLPRPPQSGYPSQIVTLQAANHRRRPTEETQDTPQVLSPQTHRAMPLCAHTRYTAGTKTTAATAACSPLPPGATVL